MQLAGELTVPQLRSAAVRTASSGTFTTTESATDTITVALVAGETYAVEASLLVTSSVGGDEVAYNLREDSDTGTGMDGGRWYIQTAAHGYKVRLYAQYTAGASGAKTFVASGQRTAGSGSCSSPAGANTPAYLWVRQIS